MQSGTDPSRVLEARQNLGKTCRSYVLQWLQLCQRFDKEGQKTEEEHKLYQFSTIRGLLLTCLSSRIKRRSHWFNYSFDKDLHAVSTLQNRIQEQTRYADLIAQLEVKFKTPNYYYCWFEEFITMWCEHFPDLFPHDNINDPTLNVQEQNLLANHTNL